MQDWEKHKMICEMTRVSGLLNGRGWDRIVPAGATLFSEGEAPCALYEVRSGCMKMTWTSSTGKETISELLLPGDIFDLPSCLDGRPYPLTCKAVSGDSTLVSAVNRGELLADPILLKRCQSLLWEQLRQQRSHPIGSATERVEVRITRALLWLASRLGDPSLGTPRFHLPLTRQELADWVCTTPETVIRAMSQLRRRGLLHESAGYLALTGYRDLIQLAEAA